MVQVPGYEFLSGLQAIAASRKLMYDVQPIAPAEFPALQQASTSRLVVYGGASDSSIYGAAWINHLVRAWHDTLHLELSADFSVAGEWRVAVAQCREFERVAGATLAHWMWCDFRGQTLHMDKYGDFPSNQQGFTAHMVATGLVEHF